MSINEAWHWGRLEGVSGESATLPPVETTQLKGLWRGAGAWHWERLVVSTQPEMQWKSQDIGNARTVRGMPVTAGVWHSGVGVCLGDEPRVLWMTELEGWGFQSPADQQ